MKISENTSVSIQIIFFIGIVIAVTSVYAKTPIATAITMPMKNMIGIVIAVAMGVFAYTEVTARLTSLETSRELFSADLLKKSEQKPVDQEQFMLVESLFGDVEKLTLTQEQNMTNKVNIEFLKSQLEKALNDIEHLKDKVRANGYSN